MAPFRLIGLPKPQACMDQVCPVGCGMHGKCIKGKCVCQQGWQGPNCKDPQCANDCAGHGQCSFQSVHSPGQCICNYGWGGAGCQRVAVYSAMRKCPNDCSANGLCMDGTCGCNVGFKGPDCSDIICSGMMTGPKCDQPRCPNDCNGRGLCLNGMCACWGFYAGKDCKMPVACQESCLHLCDTDPPTTESKQKCNTCIGTCESAAPKSSSVFGGPSLGAHNPFEDLQSTFLQNGANASKAHPSSEWSAMHKKKKHAHHEVYAVEEKPRPAAAFISTAKSGHHGHHHHHHHHHSHHHAEVSATPIVPPL